VSVVKSLLAGDDLNTNIVASNWSGDHAFAYAAIRGEIEIVRLLPPISWTVAISIPLICAINNRHSKGPSFFASFKKCRAFNNQEDLIEVTE
jgi:hypothetical protein